MFNVSNLAVFSSIKDDPVINNLVKSLDEDLSQKDKAAAYSCALADIYRAGMTSPGEYILKKVLFDDNLYLRQTAAGNGADKALEYNFFAEAELLQELADVTYEEYYEAAGGGRYLAMFTGEPVDIMGELRKRVQNIHRFGYGIYAEHTMFELDEELKVTPVTNPDDIKLSDLIDYSREQKIVYDNTVALLCGKPAANILLTGDAGTGKSSTVKAVVNELASEGLRIIQINKDQLHHLKKLLSELSENPLKFIVFIDDLSFRHDDDNSRALKAVLEGSVSAKSKNVAIYATSNRRHIIRENLKEREGDEVHVSDAMQETISLSERFGIRVGFSRPDKKTYLNIVEGLARANGIECNSEALFAGAERFALERGLRSARAAKQYIDAVLAGHIKIG